MSSKLFEALMILDEEQLPELEVFFNRLNNGLLESDRAIGTKLLQALKEGKDEETCWDDALNEKQKNNKKRIASRLFKVVENYLSSTLIPKDEVLHNLLLAKFYMNQGLVKHAKHALKIAESKNNENNSLYFNHYLYKFKIEETKAAFQKHNRNHMVEILPMLEAIDNFHEIESIRLLCEKIQRNHIFKLDDELEKTLQITQTKIKKANTDEVKVYEYMLNINISLSDEDSYYKLKILLDDNELKLGNSEKEEIIYNLTNFCIRKMNIGDTGFAIDYIRLMKRMEQSGSLLIGKHFPLPIFKNMVSAGIIAGKHDWTMNFIQEKSSLLEESSVLSREPFKNFYKAYTLLYMDNPDKCLSLMAKFRNSNMYKKDIFYKIAADKTVLKAHFQNKEIKSANIQLATLEKYIYRNKTISGELKKHYLRFFSEFKKLKKGKSLDFQKISALDKIWLQKFHSPAGATGLHS